jgi:hypothetical protein
MGTYGLDGVLAAWKQGALTTEQAVGQILQLLKQLDERLAELEVLAYPSRPTVKRSSQKRIARAISI